MSKSTKKVAFDLFHFAAFVARHIIIRNLFKRHMTDKACE